MGRMLWLPLVLSCARQGETTLGDFAVSWDEETGHFTVFHSGRPILEDAQIALGSGSADIEFQGGSYRFDEETSWTAVHSMRLQGQDTNGLFIATLRAADGAELGLLQIAPSSSDIASVSVTAARGQNRARISARCSGDDHFLGGGAHAMDVDHAGDTLTLFAREAGAGKSDTDDEPAGWPTTGTRHASSYPDPFFIQTGPQVGVQVNTYSRVDADLCSDGSTWSLTTWQDAIWLSLLPGQDVLNIVELRTRANGGVAMIPDWALAPWADAAGGEDRVRAVAQALRQAGAPASVIWTEDWSGDPSLGENLHSWRPDTAAYPDPAALDAELEALGLKWMASFSPFLSPASARWAETAPLAIRDPDTDTPYLFEKPPLREATALDLTSSDAWDWARAELVAARELGLDGWVADHGVWLPTDAALSFGDALRDHNGWPVLWQELSAEALDGADATFLTRSGWAGTPARAPIVSAGSQQTDFGTDDGLPSVIAMGLGMSVSGVPFFAHDIAGDSTEGTTASDKELWLRWCSLGAFTPIMRTNQGDHPEENWQLDTDEETLAHFARYAAEHMALFPYLRGLAAQAETRGTPLLLHPAMLYASADWADSGAWMLGPGLYVAPIRSRGATSRDVQLPDETSWYDWWTGAPAVAGIVEADVTEIPVFAPRGAIIPTFTTVPDTLAEHSTDGLIGRAEADTSRTVYVFGGGISQFEEADGTTYTTAGSATEASSTTERLASGEISAGGVTITIRGTEERDYTVVVYP